MEKALQDQILNSFPHSTYGGTLRNYGDGYSGSPVLAVQYKPRNQYGLNGIFVVKIGTEEWALREQELYDFLHSLPNTTLSPLFARGHIHSQAIGGFAAFAYDVAFDAIITSKTLMNILDEKNRREEEAKQQIKMLARDLVDWYLADMKHLVASPYQLLCHMLTEKRVGDLRERLKTSLPFWRSDTLHIMVDGLDRRLPNPLAYDTICGRITINPPYPSCRIHGDLHTGNIICSREVEKTPKLIDLDQSTPDGVAFFDLAYLEFDIMRHLLPVEQKKEREEWIELLNGSMSAIQGNKEISSWGASRAWPFLAPIREEVWRLQQSGGEPYEPVWWLATVATGLNFARKGDSTRSPFERMAGLLYAAYGLNKILDIFNIKNLPTSEGCPVVPWIAGISDTSAPDEPASIPSFQQGSPTPLADEMTPPTSVAAPPGSNVSQTPQFLLPTLDQSPTLETSRGQPESSPPSLQVEVATAVPDPIMEKQADKDEQAESVSMITAPDIQQSLQEALNLFQTEGIIYKDMCKSADQALQQLETFLAGQNIPRDDYFHRFSRDNLLELQKSTRVNLQSFRESCPPAPARKLDQLHYDEEREAMSSRLEKLQARFLEFLKTCS